MAQRADILDLETLDLSPGQGRRLDVEAPLEPIELGGQRYSIPRDRVEARIEVSRTMSGYALRLAFEAPLEGACMRCLGDARSTITVEAREVDQPGSSEELRSPYLEAGVLELGGWARDALVLALPSQLLCRESCRGLCGVCGANLNEADFAEHAHEGGPDRRWAKLDELRPRLG